MKKTLSFLVLTLVTSAVSAYTIKVKPEYIPDPNQEDNTNWKTYLVTGFDLTFSGATYTFSRIEDNFKSWEVTIASDPIGTVKLTERSDNTFSWVFDLYAIPFEISFFDNHDPREFEIKMEDQTYYMANLEPDCNSVFDIYSTKEDMEQYDTEKVQATGTAKSACGKTDWTFDIKNETLPQEVVITHVFTSVMAMTLRNI